MSRKRSEMRSQGSWSTRGRLRKRKTKHVKTAAMGMTARGNWSVSFDTPQQDFDQLVSFA
ncbi:MAG: hypothetical protein V7K40_15915 [Nostoc sp.]|uniref:hypothetical protein n=1 Tax=Nostoc sp. TaxID=1180 RepID=UPI002FF95D1B